MVLQEFAPSPLLSAYVRTYRLVHFVFDAAISLPSKAYPPKPEHCLSFYPYDKEQVTFANSGKTAGGLGAVLFGQQTEVSYRLVGHRFLLLQVVFQPGALYRLTGIPSYEITNAYLDAHDIFSHEIRYVNEQLCACTGYAAMIQVIEQFLWHEIQKSAVPHHRLDRVCNSVFSTATLPTVDELAADACLSTRQFERIFKERMGVSPKYFLKVARFEQAFRMRNKFPESDWLRIAIHCGYYDYQHLVKDYKQLTGETPVAFHAIDANAPERTFGEADTY